MLNNIEKELRRLGKPGLAKAVSGIRQEAAHVLRAEYGMPDIPLTPQKEQKSARTKASETPQQRVLEPIRFAIEIPTVSEEDYIKTREAVEAAIDDVFITTIRSVSVEDLLAEDRQREQRGESRRLGYVDNSKTMRATIPPEMEVFIDPKAVRMEGTNWLSTNDQKKKIVEAAVKFKEQLPEAVRAFVDLHMVDPSTMSQLEDKYMDEHDGALLLPNFFARTDVKTVEGLVAFVGHSSPAHRRYIDDWSRGHGYGLVFAVPVGVLPRKLAS